MDISKVVTEYLNKLEKKESVEHLVHHISRSSFHSEFTKQLKARDVKKYIYMVTFTIDPKIHPILTEELEDQIETFIIKQGERPALKVLEMEFAKEAHKDGRPHWHALVVTSKPLAKNRFNYYISKFGNVDVRKNNQGTTEEIKNYINKDSKSCKII